MINVNNVVLVGRLTKEVDLRRTQNNVPVVQFTLAVNRPKRRDMPEEADFINCVAWNHSADFLASYAKKGTIVSVEGKIRTRSYNNAQGQKVYVTEIVADNVQIITTSGAEKKEEKEEPQIIETPQVIESKETSWIIEQQDLPFY